MEFNYIEDGIDAVVIDNFYTEEQLKEIMIELKWLTKPAIMKSETQLESATNDGKIITSKRGIFLEHVFNNWRHSAIISHGFTQMAKPEFKENILKFNTLFKSVLTCNSRTHLVSYYENSDYYKPHTDNVFFTLLNYFYTEPKKFTGGEMVLYSCNSNKEAVVEIRNNRVLLIASATMHEAKEIKSEATHGFTGDGRYCSATFLSMTDLREANDSN